MSFNISRKKNCIELNVDSTEKGTYISEVFDKDFNLNLKKCTELEQRWYFGGNIDSLQCLVGRNGTGKTTILKALYNDAIQQKIASIYIDTSNISTSGKIIETDFSIVDAQKTITKINKDKTILDVENTISYFNNSAESWESTLWDRAYYINHDINTFKALNKINFDGTEDKKKYVESWLSNYKIYSTEKIMSTDTNNSVETKREALNKYFKFKIMSLGASQGEIARLRIFLKLFAYLDGVTDSQIEIFLDEPETNLHPEWCRELISILLKFLTNLFPEKNFSIFLTTHSPFIISDLPSDSIKYITKNKENTIEVTSIKEGTFGSELNSLFINNFFLEDKRGAHFSNMLLSVYEEVSSLFIVEMENSKKLKRKEDVEKKLNYLINNTSDSILKASLSTLGNSLEMVRVNNDSI